MPEQGGSAAAIIQTSQRGRGALPCAIARRADNLSVAEFVGWAVKGGVIAADYRLSRHPGPRLLTPATALPTSGSAK